MATKKTTPKKAASKPAKKAATKKAASKPAKPAKKPAAKAPAKAPEAASISATPEATTAAKPTPERVKGKTVVLTGTFSSMKRADAEKALAAMGANISGSISAKTNLLIAGADAGSKLEKAYQLNVEVLREHDLLVILGKAAPKAAEPEPASVVGALPRGLVARLDAKSAMVMGGFTTYSKKALEELIQKAGGKVGTYRSSKVIFTNDSKLKNEIVFGWKGQKEAIDEAGLLALFDTYGSKVTGPLSDFTERLRVMVGLLRQEKDVDILAFAVGAPVSEERIEAAEKKVGKISPAILNVYRQADGVSLIWAHKKNEHYKELGAQRERYRLTGYGEVIDLSHKIQGCFNLLPFEQMLWGEDWKGHIWFDFMKGDDLKEAQGLRVFDYYYFFNMAAIQTQRGFESPLVYIGDDHGASFNSKPSTFEEYINGVLAGFGSIRRRAPSTSTQAVTASDLAKILDPVKES
jgi:BRCT domain type II-containing protein